MKQTNAPLILESFPNGPRTQSKAPQFSGSHKYKQPSFINRYDVGPKFDNG